MYVSIPTISTCLNEVEVSVCMFMYVCIYACNTLLINEAGITIHIREYKDTYMHTFIHIYKQTYIYIHIYT